MTIKKSFFILTGLLLCCFGSLLLGMMWGSKTLPLADVWHYFFSNHTTSYHHLVLENRLPRTVAAFLCGGALGLSGALMQGLTRNPLGDTGLLGINTGAAASIALMAFFPILAGVSPYFLAIAGALLTALLVCLLGMRGDNHSRLILAGASVAACLGAFVNAVSQINVQTFDYLRFWASGSFGGITWVEMGRFLTFFVPFAVVGVLLGKFVNVIALDRHIAQSLGANVLLIQAVVLLVAAVLAAAAVALAGPIGFVGLGAAHLARQCVGNDYRFLLPASLLIGASLLLLSDILARVLLAPNEVATGIMTAMLGAPLLYFMVIKSAKGRA